jgi:hypothetical protein
LVDFGGSQSFDITPPADGLIGDVLVDGVSQGAISEYMFNDVVQDHSIAVEELEVPGDWTGRYSLTEETSNLPTTGAQTTTTLSCSGAITMNLASP